MSDEHIQEDIDQEADNEPTGECRHEWKETSRTFNEPVKTTYGDRIFMSSRDCSRAMHGFTNIEYRCDKCRIGEVRTITGRVS